MYYNLVFYQFYILFREASDKEAAFRATGVLSIITSLNIAFLLSIVVKLGDRQLPQFKLILAFIVMLIFVFHHFRFIHNGKFKSIIQDIETKQLVLRARLLTISVVLITILVATIAIIL